MEKEISGIGKFIGEAGKVSRKYSYLTNSSLVIFSIGFQGAASSFAVLRSTVWYSTSRDGRLVQVPPKSVAGVRFTTVALRVI